MPTVSTIVSIRPIAQYLAQIDIPRKGLYGGGVTIDLPRKIYLIGKSVQRIFENDPSNSTLTDTANYLYTLLGGYGQKALAIEQIAGTVSPIVPPAGSLPLPLDFIVSGSTIIATGQSTINLSAFIGYDINFNRGGQPQYTTNPGDGTTYYSWNKVTGDFTTFGAAQPGEQFRIFV